MRALRRKLQRLEALARVQQRVDSPTLALLRQDPARLMTAAGMEPDGWQRRLLACNAARMLLLCCRQAGKSTAAAALALRVALLQPRSPVLLLSPSLRQSGELFRKVLDLFGALGRPMGVTAESALRLELANGSRIVSLPADEATIRGFSGVALLIIDEAARVPDELYRAVRPMLAVSNGQLICLSTPYGQRGFFYAEWHSNGPWERIRIPAENCPRISKAFLAEEQRALGESWFAQEYLCSFTQREGLVYPEFAACVIDASVLQGVRAWAGCDFGWHNPSAFVVCVADADDIVYVVDEVYGPRMTDEELAARALPLVSKWGIERVFCDSAHPQSIAKLRRGHIPACAADKAVTDGIRAVGARLRTGRLKCWRTCPNLIREMALYHYDPERKLPTDEPVKEHDHAPDALRYCVMGIDRGRQPHGVNAPALEPPPPPPPDYETDYTVAPPQTRYRPLPTQSLEEEGQRRAQREHLEQHGWENASGAW